MYVAIGLGYVANRFKIITTDGYEGVHTFVVVLCIPALIFRVLAGANLYVEGGYHPSSINAVWVLS